MRDRYNRWVVLFLLACPEGEVGRGAKDERRERGWVEWRQAGRIDGKCTARHRVLSSKSSSLVGASAHRRRIGTCPSIGSACPLP